MNNLGFDLDLAELLQDYDRPYVSLAEISQMELDEYGDGDME